jgi:hypothetical protein
MYLKSRTATKVDWNERIEFLQRIKSGELTLGEAREIEDGYDY